MEYPSQQRQYLQRNSHNLPLTDRVRPPETILAQEKLIVDRKSFHISQRENQRGKFIVICEERQSHPGEVSVHQHKSNRIIVPVDGIADFIATIQKIAKV